MAILPLRLDRVCYRAGGHDLIADISLDISAGAKTLLLGANGAGKSLLLRLCHGLLGPSSGTVRWRGADADQARRRQTMVFQSPVMLRRSVRANVAYGLKLRGIGRVARAERIDTALSDTGLTALADRPARVLSGGERQRLALARAWALAPEILFLDEPTANLDPGATAAVEAIVEQIHRAGTKIVMATHDLGQARRLADEVLFLDRGRVTERAEAAAFFAGPASDPAAAFLEGRLLW
ncbi:MAG: ATP-binding cassette domain-containing protein [Alphaproteobacteria bacterium]|jgi:tungstate transport system ATP-binding protein|nr:ATP-binding cassette domain-containing protein [Alphaproteobacteria bacterium]MDP6518204.1 ATP-binding cassette domain-containing protein [Alphaproteobacteria bacterium]